MTFSDSKMLKNEQSNYSFTGKEEKNTIFKAKTSFMNNADNFAQFK